MIALQVSSEEIKFIYNAKGHLQSSISLKNNHEHNCYFKFKVTRPKYYLIKPDHGFCDSKKVVTVSIVLHQDGVNDAQTDKVKLYFKFTGRDHMEPTRGWEKEEPEALNIRFPVVIYGLPQEFKKLSNGAKNSEVKSLSNSKFGQPHTSNLPISQSSIKQKQSRVNILKSEIDMLKRGAAKVHKTSQGLKEYLLVAVIGLIIGFIASIFL